MSPQNDRKLYTNTSLFGDVNQSVMDFTLLKLEGVQFQTEISTDIQKMDYPVPTQCEKRVEISTRNSLF